MKILIILIFMTPAGTSYGQSHDKFEAFNPSDYPANKYLVKLDTASFFQFKIEIRQVKQTGQTNAPSDFYCRAWLSVTEGSKAVNKFTTRQSTL